ncbi:MAG: single-stranded DNA-binding protein [Chloracidobacterium sp.]|nr:single-stranded DNA-binding protein [Chloracidobacterium sp.]
MWRNAVPFGEQINHKRSNKNHAANISILGNAARDSSLKYSEKGTPVASFPIASNSFKNSPEGRVQVTHWFNVVAFGKTAETLAEHVKKGTHLLVHGRLSFSPWSTDSGEPNQVPRSRSSHSSLSDRTVRAAKRARNLLLTAPSRTFPNSRARLFQRHRSMSRSLISSEVGCFCQLGHSVGAVPQFPIEKNERWTMRVAKLVENKCGIETAAEYAPIVTIYGMHHH